MLHSHGINYAAYTRNFLIGNTCIFQIQEVYGEAGVWGFWNGVFPTLFMVCENLL